MKNLLTFLFAFLQVGNFLFSQPLVIDWQQCFGGTEIDGGSGLIKIPSGYLLFGTTYSDNGNFAGTYGNGDFFLIWTDSVGNLVSLKTFGGTELDDGTDIKATADGGFVMFGVTFSNNFDVDGNHGSGDLWVVKVNDSGMIQWQKCLGGSAIEQVGMNIETTTESGFLCAGATASNDGDVTGFHGFYDYWPVRLNVNGSIIWESCFGGTMADWCLYVTQTPDKGMILAGSTDTPDGDVLCDFHGGTGDGWIVKLDSLGNLEWQNCFGGSGMDNLYKIIVTPDGGYLCAGVSNSEDGQVSGNHGGFDFWVVKLDHTGSLIWQKCYGGSSNEVIDRISPSSDGNYLILGHTYSNDGDVTGNHSLSGFQDIWLVKISPSGQLIWEQCIGGSGDDGPGNLIEDPNGEFTIIGFTSNSDNAGDVNCNFHGGMDDIWLVHLIDTTYIGINDANEKPPIVEVYPNPATSFIKINYDFSSVSNNLPLTIINGIGKPVQTYILNGNSGQISVDLTDYAAGVYAYALWYKEGLISGKFIKLK